MLGSDVLTFITEVGVIGGFGVLMIVINWRLIRVLIEKDKTRAAEREAAHDRHIEMITSSFNGAVVSYNKTAERHEASLAKLNEAIDRNTNEVKELRIVTSANGRNTGGQG